MSFPLVAFRDSGTLKGQGRPRAQQAYPASPNEPADSISAACTARATQSSEPRPRASLLVSKLCNAILNDAIDEILCFRVFCFAALPVRVKAPGLRILAPVESVLGLIGPIGPIRPIRPINCCSFASAEPRLLRLQPDPATLEIKRIMFDQNCLIYHNRTRPRFPMRANHLWGRSLLVEGARRNNVSRFGDRRAEQGEQAGR
jgi:hypothetical protein